jgi:hypothetical protein
MEDGNALMAIRLVCWLLHYLSDTFNIFIINFGTVLSSNAVMHDLALYNFGVCLNINGPKWKKYVYHCETVLITFLMWICGIL